MSTLAIRLLVLGNALLLTLPQGWCVALTFHRAEKSAPSKASCCSTCHVPGQSQRSVPKPVPSGPFKNCCCRAEVTAPPRVEVGRPEIVLAAAPGATENTGSRLAIAPDGLPRFYAAISQHVLNCLWLC
jgi:hypothetical protein